MGTPHLKCASQGKKTIRLHKSVSEISATLKCVIDMVSHFSVCSALNILSPL